MSTAAVPWRPTGGGRRSALLVGTGQFDDNHYRDLPSPRPDLVRVATILQAPHVDFTVEDTLWNPGLVQLRKQIYQFFVGAARDDHLLLYLTGHGEISPSGYHYILKETEYAWMPPTAYEGKTLGEAIYDSPAKSKTVIVDACYAGELARLVGPKGHPSMDENLKKIATLFTAVPGQGTSYILACSADELAYERPDPLGDDTKSYSLFTSAICLGLRTGHATLPSSRYIRPYALAEYARLVLREYFNTIEPLTRAIQQPGVALCADQRDGGPALATVPNDAPPAPADIWEWRSYFDHFGELAEFRPLTDDTSPEHSPDDRDISLNIQVVDREFNLQKRDVDDFSEAIEREKLVTLVRSAFLGTKPVRSDRGVLVRRLIKGRLIASIEEQRGSRNEALAVINRACELGLIRDARAHYEITEQSFSDR